MKVFTAQQMRDFDRVAIEDYGIPSIVLMENAALRVVEFLEVKFAPLSEKKICVLCGKGNNGGDGLAIARLLLSSGAKLFVAHAAPDAYRGDALANFQILNKRSPIGYERNGNSNANFGYFDWSVFDADASQGENADKDVQELMNFCGEFVHCDLAVDAYLGTGFQAQRAEDEFSGARDTLLQALSMAPQVVSVDILSGLDSQTGQLQRPMMSGHAQSANHTVTFAAPKRGFFAGSLAASGEIWVGDIGTRPIQMEHVRTGAQTLDLQTAKHLLPHRSQDAHKGDAGRALLVGGSFGMSGSICLASKAALATGAGLVSAALPREILPIFAASVLEAVSHPLPQDPSGHLISSAADALPALWKEVQVVALGPGLGRTDEAFEFARRVARECPVALVIDADALHALPAIADDVKARKAPTILTPHPGEMGVLMDSNAKAVNDARFETVAACARKYGATVVLKGARTLVCDSGGEIWVNLTGNPGMATGGAGDVLTGTIAGLLAQLKNADNATKLGVYLHGMAGDLTFQTRGNGLVAGDIAAHLPQALLEIQRREVERINGRLRRLE